MARASLESCPSCGEEVPAGARVCPRDGTPLEGTEPTRIRNAPPPLWDDRTDQHVPPPDLIGALLGEYRVEEQIGSGGMGLVYRAVQPVIGKTVAIKVLRKEVSRDPAHVERLLSEARAVNAARHRAIIDIFNFGTLADGRQYLVMEYLEGRGLDALLAEQRVLPLGQTLAFVRDLASALAAAHAAGVVHRDLKPSNVFVVKQGGVQYVKLLDFGLAERTVDAQARSGESGGLIMGTPEYMAPEQARGEEALPQTDLYSLGVMTFELVSGRLPFEAKTPMEYLLHHVNTPPPDVRTVKPSTPPELAALILRMMAKDPAQRPASAEEVRLEIKSLLASTGISARKTGERLAIGASGEKHRPRASGQRPMLGEEPSLRSGERDRVRASGQRDRPAVKKAEPPPPPPPTVALPPPEVARAARSRVPLRALGLGLGVAAALAAAWFAAGWVDRLLGPAELPPVATGGPPPAMPIPRPAPKEPEAPTGPGPGQGPDPVAEAKARARATPKVGKGKLTLVTIPEAKVRSGGRALGTTPLFSVSLEPGVHHLELTGTDGVTKALSVPIEAGKTAKFRLKLAELPDAR